MLGATEKWKPVAAQSPCHGSKRLPATMASLACPPQYTCSVAHYDVLVGKGWSAKGLPPRLEALTAGKSLTRLPVPLDPVAYKDTRIETGHCMSTTWPQLLLRDHSGAWAA